MDKKEKLKRQIGAPTHGKAATQGNVGATDRKELNFLGRERNTLRSKLELMQIFVTQTKSR